MADGVQDTDHARDPSFDRRRPVAPAPNAFAAWLAPGFLILVVLSGGGFIWSAATSSRDLKYVTDRVEELRHSIDERRTDDLKLIAEQRGNDVRALSGQLADLRRDFEARRNGDDAFSIRRTDYLIALDDRVKKTESTLYYMVRNQPEPRK